MKDYHNLYWKCDFLLLPDEFEKLRNRWLENYVLCRSNHFSAPVLSWDAMLSITKVELDLISDFNMNMFFEKEMEGSISYICEKYRKANNRYWYPRILKNQQNILNT